MWVIRKSYDEEYLDTFLYGIDFDYSLQKGDHSFIIGTSYQQDKGDDIKQRDILPTLKDFGPNLTNGNIARESTGFFFQDVWNLNEQISMVAGIRYELLNEFDNELNYRLGTTGQFESGIYGKLLFGTAFRVPSYREYLDVVGFNDDLKPEHLNTLELQVGFLYDKGDINLTFFHNAYKDFIGEINVTSITNGASTRQIGDDEMAFNFNSKTISGFELYGLFQPTEHLSLILGASYIIDAKEELGNITAGVVTTIPINTEEVDIKTLSNFTLNLAATYNFNSKYAVGTNLFYVSDRSEPTSYQQSVPASVINKSNLDAYVLIDVFANVDLTDHFTMRFKVANVLDEKMYSPPFGGAKYDLEWPGREFNVDITYGF